MRVHYSYHVNLYHYDLFSSYDFITGLYKFIYNSSLIISMSFDALHLILYKLVSFSCEVVIYLLLLSNYSAVARR